MKSLFFIILSIASAMGGSLNSKYDEVWEKFKITFHKVYDKEFESARRLIWEENLAYIQKHNLEYDLGFKSFAMGINEYSDLTHEEFKEMFLPRIFNLTESKNFETYLPHLNYKEVPSAVDWTKKGYVTPVKNQSVCGSCWSFSATGSLEGQHFRKTKKLISLSEQQLVDCNTQSNHGCQGGSYDHAFIYIKQNGGIMSEKDYPYLARQAQCHFDVKRVVAKCTGFSVVPHDENSLKIASASEGPISVAIDASRKSFQHYSHGVYYDPECSSEHLNHAVLAVGYGTEGTDDYWLVKNSWGHLWGDKGYVKMSRNKQNNCGIASFPVFPRV